MSVRVWTRTRTRIVAAVGVLLSLAVVAAVSAAPVPIGGPAVSIGQGTGSLVVAPGYPARLATGPLPGSLVTPGAVSAAHPWSSSRPTGHGRLYAVYLPAPWTGGIRTAIEIDIYLPPGYDAGSARYPVIYEVPYSAGTWQDGMRLPSVLDALITAGSIPPEIVVFAGQFGGPYADSECANSFDGREWFDRFVATTLVHWVDTHLRTIATPAARATFGFSQGGYINALFGGQGKVAEGFMPPSTVGYKAENLPTYDVATAKADLAAANLTPAQLKIDLYYPSNVTRPYMPDPKNEAVAVAGDLTAIGFTVTLKTIDWHAGYYNTANTGQLPMFLLGWTCDWAGADNFLVTAFFGYSNGQPARQFGYKNDQMNDLFNQALQAPTVDAANALWGQAQDLIAADLPMVPIVNSTPPGAFNPKVHGFVGAANGIEHFNGVWIQQ
jgi:hypothetical protein